MPTRADFVKLAAETDETVNRVSVAWEAYIAGCYERHEPFSWTDFVRRWKQDRELKPCS